MKSNSRLKSPGPKTDALALVLEAASFAADRHRKQRRKDLHATPYINHPLALASTLAVEGGVTDPEVIAAGLCCTTPWRMQTTASELREAFGRRVADMVEEVTDDPDLDNDDRKQHQIDHAPHLSHGAKKCAKLADKISNLRDVADHPPHAWGLQRKREYSDLGGARRGRVARRPPGARGRVRRGREAPALIRRSAASRRRPAAHRPRAARASAWPARGRRCGARSAAGGEVVIEVFRERPRCAPGPWPG